jgi:hypothetical protein
MPSLKSRHKHYTGFLNQKIFLILKIFFHYNNYLVFLEFITQEW